MELKEILSHAEAVQFLLYSIQHGKQTRTALKKALPKDVPTDALLDAMTDFGFLCRDGKQFRLNQERLEHHTYDIDCDFSTKKAASVYERFHLVKS